MGCGKSVSKSAKSFPLSTTMSKTEISYSLYSQSSMKRKSCIAPKASNNFWGSNPYYVVSNRLMHLSHEVQSKYEFDEILASINKILTETAEDFEEEKLIKLNDFGVKWVTKYRNSVSFLKSIGFEFDGKYLRLMREVSRFNILNRVKEIKYFCRRSNGMVLKSHTIG